MNKKTRIILIGVIVLFILGMALYPTVKKNFFDKENENNEPVPIPASSNRNRPLNVNAKVINYENLTEIFRTIGTLIPDEEVDLSFETSGKIIEIFFKEGTNVKKGELLAKVNDKPLQAELKKLEAQIPLATERVNRQKTLLAKDAVSQEAYEQVTTELDKLDADIELVKANIAQTELRAPFDGIIGLRQVSEGSYVSPTTVIAVLTKYIPLKLEFSINEKQMDQVRSGTNLTFMVERDLNKYNATVYAVESKVELNTFSLAARALYPNINGKLRPGRSTTIEIVLDEIKNTLTVPSEAIIAEMGRDVAYIYKNGKAQQVELTKGIRTESKVQILEGLEPGDTLLVTGVMQLRDGMSVILDRIEE